ncbi:MAG TPA: TonB family protein [Pyrinomonadaceae bacterium]|jgi:TonB family protein|nr:TonB family protein [Pyrinomonadaceae bacterium]
MLKRTPRLSLTLLLLASSHAAVTTARAQAGAQAPVVLASSARATTETDRDRDGLQGPVRRVRTENAKLVFKEGKMVEGQRNVLETATYDIRGAKIDNAYFLAAGGALTGREVYKYDDRGNIVEMTLFNADGSVLSKEKYDYEFDAMGNWTKMLTSVAVVENGKLSFEPTEVTFRFLAYFLEDNVTKKLQPGQTPAPQNATASAPAAVSATVNAHTAAPQRQQQPQQAAPAPKKLASLPPIALSAPATSAAPINAPTAQVAANAAAPVVKVEDDMPPPRPVAKAPVRPISGGVLNGKALSLPAPSYPEFARRMRTTGVVAVEVVVDVSGRVIAAKAVSGPESLRAEAESAAMRARFAPTLLSGQPVKMTGTINYNFVF